MIRKGYGGRAGPITRAWGLSSAALGVWLNDLELEHPQGVVVERPPKRAQLHVVRIAYDESERRLRLLPPAEPAGELLALPRARSVWAAGDEVGVRSLHVLDSDSRDYAVVRFSERIRPPCTAPGAGGVAGSWARSTQASKLESERVR